MAASGESFELRERRSKAASGGGESGPHNAKNHCQHTLTVDPLPQLPRHHYTQAERLLERDVVLAPVPSFSSSNPLSLPSHHTTQARRRRTHK